MFCRNLQQLAVDGAQLDGENLVATGIVLFDHHYLIWWMLLHPNRCSFESQF
jgi:hypothetical protein